MFLTLAAKYIRFMILRWFYFKQFVNRKRSKGVNGLKPKRENTEGVVCSICNQHFHQQSNLKRHMQLHTGHYKFYCDKCRKGFLIKRDYIEHKRAHQGLKYHCDHCSKPFSTQKGLTYHLSIHTGKYRFECNDCSKGFNKKPDFDKHVQSHTQWIFHFMHFDFSI